MVRGRRGWLALSLAGSMVLAACGTRLSDEAFEGERRIVTVGDGSGTALQLDDGAPAMAGQLDDDVTAPSDGSSPLPGAAPSPTGGGQDPDGTSGGDAAPAEGPRGPNQASDVGVTESTIRIGSIVAENGVLGDAFAPAARGLRAWVQATNAAGGIGGRSIELFTCDDREDRSRALECARRLVERDQVFAILAVNTRAFGGAAQYLHDQGVPVYGFPITNSMYRYPKMFSIYYGSYPRDGQSVGFEGQVRYSSGLSRFFREEMNLTKAAMVSYDVAESRQAGESFAKGFELEGFEVSRYVVSFAAPSFDQPVADMQRRGVEIVFDTMDDGANRRLCDAMARRGFSPKAKLTTVVGIDARIGQNYNEACRNVIFSNGPSLPFTHNHPEVARFRDAYARFQPGLPLHQWALEAWGLGNIFAEAMEAMGPAPTRDGFVEFLNTMPPNDAGGIMIGREYHVPPYPQDRAEDCFHVVRWLDDQGGWVSASGFPHCVPDAHVYYTPALEQGN
jgi:branched-chain amino acid transport system substrate-binding protein